MGAAWVDNVPLRTPPHPAVAVGSAPVSRRSRRAREALALKLDAKVGGGGVGDGVGDVDRQGDEVGAGGRCAPSRGSPVSVGVCARCRCLSFGACQNLWGCMRRQTWRSPTQKGGASERRAERAERAERRAQKHPGILLILVRSACASVSFFDGTIPIPILPGLTRPDVGVPRQNLTDLHVFQMPRAHI